MTTSSGNATLVLLLSTCCFAAFACEPNDVKFGYTGSIGPDHWGTLSPNYTKCAKGTMQSPIDICTAEVVYDPYLEPLHRDYTVANATLEDNIFNIELRYEKGAGGVTIDGKQYKLQQMHWHSPSEHTIDGQRFPVELHMVHASDDGNITVVAMLYRFGMPDPVLWQIRDELAALSAQGCNARAEKGVPVPAGDVNLWSLRQDSHSYYRYVGSLTTPPCTENVIWSILGQVRELTFDQAFALMEPLQEGYRHNNRPTQPLNGRTVEVYDGLSENEKVQSS